MHDEWNTMRSTSKEQPLLKQAAMQLTYPKVLMVSATTFLQFQNDSSSTTGDICVPVITGMQHESVSSSANYHAKRLERAMAQIAK